MEYLNNVRFDYELVQYHLSSCGHIGHESLTLLTAIHMYSDYEIIKKTSDCIFGRL